jgi:FkbM family methyltransferase
MVKLADGEVGLRSVFKKADGSPRFLIPLPPKLISDDPGIKYMAINEGLSGGCEYQTRRFLDAHLGADDLFIDVGAHWGLFTLTVASLHPGALSVIAVEADPYNVTRLIKSIQLNRLGEQIEIIPCAIGAGAGTAELIGGRGTMGHSVGGVSYLASDSTNIPPATVSVPVMTLDAIIADRPSLAHKPVFLKVDVEGFEIDVLRGAADLIASGRIKAMVIEKGKAYTRDPALADFGKMLDGLKDNGFACYRFKGHNHPGPLIPYELSQEDCDIVAISADITPLPHYE